MTTEAPSEWDCSRCRTVNSSGPSIRRRSDGGETWTLICQHCTAKYPIAEITAKGVRIRNAIRYTTQTQEKARLIEALQAEITKSAGP